MTSVQIWRQAFSFHIRNFTLLLPIFPVLLVPVATDALHTILINREEKDLNQSRVEAVVQALRITPDVFLVKLYFWGAALGWSLVPVYGWMKEIDYKLAWGMASNVVILEEKIGEFAVQGCRDLIQKSNRGLAIRALVTVPPLLLFLTPVTLLVPETILNPFWVWLVSVVWITFPAAAAANTYCYFHLRASS